jgi:hypothetical protein
MRITLPSGTEAEIAEPSESDASPSMGLVITPDIFGLRPLFDDMVSRLASVWSMTVCAVEPFPGLDLGDEVEARFAAVPSLDDDVHLRDLVEAADATGCDTVGLLGFCMGGMYCFKAARSDRFSKIASFYGMIRLPEAWKGPGQGEPLDHLGAGHTERVLAIIGDSTRTRRPTTWSRWRRWGSTWCAIPRPSTDSRTLRSGPLIVPPTPPTPSAAPTPGSPPDATRYIAGLTPDVTQRARSSRRSRWVMR